MGDPYRLDSDDEPSYSLLESRTFVTLADEDAGPTKAWIVTNRNDPKVKPIYKSVYGKRPKEELYDLKKDPDQMKNIATSSKHVQIVKELRQRLMKYLRETNDPRLTDDGKFFETPPMAVAVKGQRTIEQAITD